MALASRRLKGATKPEGRNTTRLAVLIDGDNTSAKHAQAIFDEIVKLGEATVRRIYGDFSHGRLSGWDGAIKSLAILQHQQRSNSRGKNASDIALVIDAVDLMYKRTLDGVVLVSSDSDFTRLAQRLREEGLVVYGFGERQCRIRHCRSPNTNVGNRASNPFARATADTYLNGTPKDPPPVRVADQVFTQFADEVARASGSEKREEFIASLREMVRQQPDFTTFPSSRRSGSYEEAIHTQVMAPLIPSESDRSRKGQPTPPTSCSGNPASLVSLAMKLSGKLPHELTEDDIMLAGQYEGSIISNVISEVFATYKVGQFIWAHKRIETEEVPYATVLAECRREYPPPWDILRDALAAMRTAAGDDGLFDFEFSDPDQHELNMANYEQFQFQTRMTNRTSGAQYDLNSLSSGERVLMALCLSSFNQQIGRRRPKLLLLDELDAVLHPSMVCALVATLKELFVARGTKVLLTSHSPMTVAALAETEIFRVERTGGRVRIGPTTKTDAIDELSEGIATVDAGLRIAAFDDAQVTILTEGNNARHLKRWVELHFPDGVRVFDQLNQHTSKSQLVAYGRLPGCMDSATHFVIVWDCDATGEAQKLRDELRQGAKVTPFAFRRLQGNQIARCGIENNYEDCVLKPYAIAKTDSDGHVFAYEFNGSRKKEFAEHVRQHATSEYFVHFEELRKVASDILATASPAGISEE